MNKEISNEQQEKWRSEFLSICTEEMIKRGCTNARELSDAQLFNQMDSLDAYLAACKLRQEEIDRLKRELNQQRFNNQHNLSIDQKIADEIEKLKQELKLANEGLDVAFLMGSQLRNGIKTGTQVLATINEEYASIPRRNLQAMLKEIQSLKQLLKEARTWVKISSGHEYLSSEDLKEIDELVKRIEQAMGEE